jgi:hypothetical protein
VNASGIGFVDERERERESELRVKIDELFAICDFEFD